LFGHVSECYFSSHAEFAKAHRLRGALHKQRSVLVGSLMAAAHIEARTSPWLACINGQPKRSFAFGVSHTAQARYHPALFCLTAVRGDAPASAGAALAPARFFCLAPTGWSLAEHQVGETAISPWRSAPSPSPCAGRGQGWGYFFLSHGKFAALTPATARPDRPARVEAGHPQ